MTEIVATYTHGTPRFWVYEYIGPDGIVKFWIPHSIKKQKADGQFYYQSLSPPTTLDIRVEFQRPAE